MPPTAQPTRLPKIGATVPSTAPPTQPPVTARLVVQPRPAHRHRTARVVVAPGPGAGRPHHEHQYSHYRIQHHRRSAVGEHLSLHHLDQQENRSSQRRQCRAGVERLARCIYAAQVHARNRAAVGAAGLARYAAGRVDDHRDIFFGYLLDLIAPVFFVPFELYFFRKWLVKKNRVWLDRLIGGHREFIETDYRAFIDGRVLDWKHTLAWFEQRRCFHKISAFLLSHVMVFFPGGSPGRTDGPHASVAHQPGHLDLNGGVGGPADLHHHRAVFRGTGTCAGAVAHRHGHSHTADLALCGDHARYFFTHVFVPRLAGLHHHSKGE